MLPVDPTAPPTVQPPPPVPSIVQVAAVSTDKAGAVVLSRTPAGYPDQIVTYISPLVAIVIRAGKAFFDTLVGVLGVQTTGIMPQVSGTDFLHSLYVAVGIAGMAAAVSVIRNLAQLFSTLEQKFPTLQA